LAQANLVIAPHFHGLAWRKSRKSSKYESEIFQHENAITTLL
jgi:hypothetical protein